MKQKSNWTLVTHESPRIGQLVLLKTQIGSNSHVPQVARWSMEYAAQAKQLPDLMWARIPS